MANIEEGLGEVASKTCILWIPRGIPMVNPIEDMFNDNDIDEKENSNSSALAHATAILSRLEDSARTRTSQHSGTETLKKDELDIGCQTIK